MLPSRTCRPAAARCSRPRRIARWCAADAAVHYRRNPGASSRRLNPKSGPVAECSKTASGTRDRCSRGHSPRNALSLLRVQLRAKRLSHPGRLPSACTLEAHPQRGRPIGRPAVGRRCWAAAVAASGRGLQPATSRRRQGAGTRTGEPGRRKRWPPPGGRPRGRCSGSRRRGRRGPLPCSRRGGRHRQLRWPWLQAARAPPLRRCCRTARLTAGAASGRTASDAPGVPRAGVVPNRPPLRRCSRRGRRTAGATVGRPARGTPGNPRAGAASNKISTGQRLSTDMSTCQRLSTEISTDQRLSTKISTDQR